MTVMGISDYMELITMIVMGCIKAIAQRRKMEFTETSVVEMVSNEFLLKHLPKLTTKYKTGIELSK